MGNSFARDFARHFPAETKSTDIADFWNMLSNEEQRNWENACNLLRFEQADREPDPSKVMAITSTGKTVPLLTCTKITNDVYSLFRRFEPDACISHLTKKLTEFVSIEALCEQATQINMHSDRALFSDEALTKTDSNYIAFIALLCTRPLLTRPFISRTRFADRNACFVQEYPSSMVESYIAGFFKAGQKHGVHRGNSKSDCEEAFGRRNRRRAVTSFPDFRRTSAMPSTPPVNVPNHGTGAKYVPPDNREEQVSTKSLLEYVRQAIRPAEVYSQSTATDNPSVQSSSNEPWSIVASEAAVFSATSFDEIVNRHYPYAQEKAEHKRLLIRVADSQRKLLLAAASSGRKGVHQPESEAPLTVMEQERTLEENYRHALKLNCASHGDRRESEARLVGTDRAFEDSFVRALTLCRAKRLYFHLVRELVSFELERSTINLPNSSADLFASSPRADGSVILEECRALLLIPMSFHKVAYLGALVKCYCLNSRLAYFNHTRAIIESIAVESPAGSFERQFLVNTCSTLVNEMIADLRYYLNQFASIFGDETNCAAWLRLLLAACGLQSRLVATATDASSQVKNAVDTYISERLLRLKESIARVLREKSTPIAVSFVRVLVVRSEVARLTRHGITRAFESVCQIDLAKCLVQNYFFELISYANSVFSRSSSLATDCQTPIGNDSALHSADCDGRRLKTFSELFALLYSFKKLETTDWKDMLASSCDSDHGATGVDSLQSQRVSTYREFMDHVTRFWRLWLKLIMRHVDRLLNAALLRKKLGEEICGQIARNGEKESLITAVRCTDSLLDFLVLLRRFTHCYFVSASCLLNDLSASFGAVAVAVATPLADTDDQSSGCFTLEPPSNRKVESHRPSGTSVRESSPRLVCKYHKLVANSLILPFAYSCVFVELADLPASRLSLAFCESNEGASWNQFVAQSVARYDLLWDLLDRQPAANLLERVHNRTYSRLLSAINTARVTKLMSLDPSIEAEKLFLLKFTTSLSGRLNDLLALLELLRNDSFLELVNRYGAPPRAGAATRTCVSCESPLRTAATCGSGSDGDSGLSCNESGPSSSAYENGNECLCCSKSRSLHSTVTNTIGQLLRSCFSLVAAHAAKAYFDVFTCSYLRFPRELNAQTSVIKTDESKFPAASYLAEFSHFCHTGLLPQNAQIVLSQVYDVISCRLHSQYVGFLRAFVAKSEVPGQSLIQKQRAIYLRFSTQQLLTCASENSLVLEETTRQRLERLSLRLELHCLSTEQLLFVWCLLECCSKQQQSQQIRLGEEAVVQRLQDVEFRKCLANLYGLQYDGYGQMLQVFATSIQQADWKMVAVKVYNEYLAGGINSIDALMVIWLRRSFKDDRIGSALQKYAKAHRLAEVSRYYDSLLREDPANRISDHSSALMRNLQVPVSFHEDLAFWVDQLARRTSSARNLAPCCSPSPHSADKRRK